MSKKRDKKADQAAAVATEESPTPPVNGAAGNGKRGFWDNVRVPDLVKYRIDVVKRQSRLSKRMQVKLKKIAWILGPPVALGTLLVSSDVALNLFLNLVQLAGQLLFAVFYMIIQFGALFWFMSRSKIEKIRPEDPKIITFDDYWGQPRLKRLVRQWLGLLNDREQFVSMGGRYINGLLLYGPPGTGKTMLAKAMSGEAGVAFISIEGSGFRAMFMGVDVMKMIWFIRKARKLARRYGAAIAYIDEIDAVGASRGGVMGGGDSGGGMGGMGGGNGALTRLLYEMDGIESKTLREKVQARLYKLAGRKAPPRNWHVLFMGSTNRPDVIDPALKRPGRFDQLIQVDLPDASGRREIVEGYLRTVNHDDTVDVESIVLGNKGATPAQIMAALTKDSVRIALFDHRNAISQDDIEKAFLQQYLGIENPIEEWSDTQRFEVAVHEAGHAVAQYYLMPDARIVHLTILRRGGALGFLLHEDEEEMFSQSHERKLRRAMVALAGQAAMRVVFGRTFTGPGSDYQNVRTTLLGLYVEGYFGPPLSASVGQLMNGSGDVTGEERKLLQRVWIDLEERTGALLRAHETELRAIAENLLEHNSLGNKQVTALLGPRPESPDPKALPGPAGDDSPAGAAVADATPAEATPT